MKTLLLTLEYPPFKGGVANYYGNMAKYWPIDEKLNILDDSSKELISDTCCFSWLPAISALNRKMKSGKFDYILVGQILPLGTATLLVSFFNPIKYGVFLHGMDLTLAMNSWRKKILSRLILWRADKILCANSYVLEKLLKFYPKAVNKSKVLNPGTDSGLPVIDNNEIDYLKNKYTTDGKTILFSLGRLVKRKGVDRVIEALSIAPEEQMKNWLYFVAGAGKDEAYLKKLIPPRLADKIIFIGQLTESEKWLWLNFCDVFLMPSRNIDGDFEGFGIVYLEANLCGKPVIAGDSGGVKDAVLDKETGLLVNPNNPEEILSAINQLASDKNLRDFLGKNGQKRAFQDFNWEKRAIEISEFIKIK